MVSYYARLQSVTIEVRIVVGPTGAHSANFLQYEHGISSSVHFMSTHNDSITFLG